MHLHKLSFITVMVWFLTSVAFSNGQLAPELELIHNAKNSAEYPILKDIQDLTLDLQLLQLTIKNRRDAKIEGKITSALEAIDAKSKTIGEEFRSYRLQQVSALMKLIDRARRFGPTIGVEDFQWTDLIQAIKDEQIQAGTIAVHAKTGVLNQTLLLNIITLSPIRIGRQTVWQFTVPPRDKFSYWAKAYQAASKMENPFPTRFIRNQALAGFVKPLNELYAKAKVQAEAFYRTSHRTLYNAFEGQHYGILNRMNLARKKLAQLGNTNTSMGVPAEYAALYNQLLEHLFSYGMDISFSGTVQRDFTIKGFLFGPTPEEAETLLTKLRYSPSQNTYNSPSS